MAVEQSAYLECGRVINTHGFRGEVKIEPWCNSAADFTRLPRVFREENGQMTEMKLLRASVFRTFVIASLSGITDEAAAQALKTQVIYAARGDISLPDGGYFLADLPGLPVIDAHSGRQYGTYVDFINQGASDLWEIRTPTGIKLLPAVKAFIARVETGKAIYVTPIPGLFDEEGVVADENNRQKTENDHAI